MFEWFWNLFKKNDPNEKMTIDWENLGRRKYKYFR